MSAVDSGGCDFKAWLVTIIGANREIPLMPSFDALADGSCWECYVRQKDWPNMFHMMASRVYDRDGE